MLRDATFISSQSTPLMGPALIAHYPVIAWETTLLAAPRQVDDRIAGHNLLRDVIFETAASAVLGPTKEERHILLGTIARPGDVTIRRWSNGKDGAIDVTVTSF